MDSFIVLWIIWIVLLTGWLFDTTQNYDTVFGYSGGVFLLHALLILLITALKKFCPQQRSLGHSTPSSDEDKIEVDNYDDSASAKC